MHRGYISLHRKIQDSWLWKSSKEFSELQAWLHLLLKANHKPTKFYSNGMLLELDCGELPVSEKDLQKEWKWGSRTRVRNFLKLLEQEHMIERKISQKGTILKVSNYAIYQSFSEGKKTTEEQLKDNRKTTEEQLKDTNNNVNNANNVNKYIPPIIPHGKIKYAEFVLMTNAEYTALIDSYGEADTKSMIEILDNYKGSKGKKYKSDYRAIKSWVVSALEEEKQKTGRTGSVYNDNDLDYDELEKIMQGKM